MPPYSLSCEIQISVNPEVQIGGKRQFLHLFNAKTFTVAVNLKVLVHTLHELNRELSLYIISLKWFSDL